MEQAITGNMFLGFCGAVVGVVGCIVAIRQVHAMITTAHDRKQKWDECSSEIKKVKEEQCMLTYCMMATLDGLHQLGCNGNVTTAREKLDKYMNKQAHGVE